MIALSMPRKTRTPTTHQVRTQIKRLEKYINNLRMIAATQVYRSKVIRPLFSKALTVGRAVCVLVDKGFPAEAFENQLRLAKSMKFLLRAPLL